MIKQLNRELDRIDIDIDYHVAKVIEYRLKKITLYAAIKELEGMG